MSVLLGHHWITDVWLSWVQAIMLWRTLALATVALLTVIQGAFYLLGTSSSLGIVIGGGHEVLVQ